MAGGDPSGRDTMRTWPGSHADGQGDFTLPARWRLGRRLGSGGQAEVWLAEDAEVGEWVAVKVFRADLSETDRERLRREVRLGRSLQHPGLVRLFELVESGGRLALVMEWLPGGNLVRRLDAGPLPVSDVCRIADQCLAALEYLHAHGVVHRDVKASNLLLDGDGNVRLADLGLARPVEGGHDLTRTHATVGTPAYMSPEQLRGETATPAADLYSLGATMYQLLTGALVFDATSHFEVARHHLASRVRNPRQLRADCPRWLARFVLRLLEKRPEDRWPDGGAARLALQKRVGLTSPRVRRRLAAAAGLTVAVAAGATVAGRMAVRGLWHPRAERVESSGREVRGLNARGATVWRHAFDCPVRQVERADLTGSGDPATIVAAWPEVFRRVSTRYHSEVAILDRRGGVITRIVPEELITHWPFEYPEEFAPIVGVVDIGRAGAPAVVVNCRHRYFYPTVVEVFWPRTGVWEPVLYHSGWIGDVVAVAGSDPPRLRFEGVNNRLCMYPVIGEIVVRDPEPSAVRPEGAISIDGAASFPPESSFRLAWYTPLDLQGPAHGSLRPGTDGGAVVSYPQGTRAVDRNGNPEDGPNAGRDLSAARRSFLTDLAGLGPSDQPVTAEGVKTLLAVLRENDAELLRERPYRTILETTGARALARAGGVPEAIAMLRRVREYSDAPEVTLRLAHLEGIAGNLAEAKRLAQEVLNGPNANRRYDAAQLLRHLSFETRDVDGVRAAATAIGYFEQANPEAVGVTASLWSGAHMWWDELTDTDTRGVSSAFVPAAEAVACVARWRLGRSLPGDPDAMKASQAANPDAAGPCRAARAAALIGLGRPREAASLLDELAAHMESTGIDDFDQQQGLGLARAIYVKALMAAGEREQAIRLARRWQAQLRPGLLPRILVDEVLHDARGAVDGR
ncbi:MAG TPA: serine/threonine-protein kinase [Thermoanaerobaculaceae bacterium]|nr:serine/threonine-protein kinase [Thermoanaerobaculaceae bacterium]